MCSEINVILSKFGYFLRVFELKNKFCQLTMKDKTKQKVVRQLQSCLIEKYSSFTIISIEYQKKQRKLFKPIDIIYKPTKHIEIEPLCYFSEDISKAYFSLHSKGKKGLSRAHKVYQCFYCNKLFVVKPRQKKHMENCSGKPGVVYNFNNQCLISYQDNFYTKGDVPIVIYFGFETTAPTDKLPRSRAEKNVCTFIRNDCRISSSIKISSNYHLQKFCAFNRTINNFRLFFSGTNYFY